MKKLLTGCALFFAFIILLFMLVLVMIPDQVVSQFVIQTAASQGVKLQARQLGTALPLGLKGREISIMDREKTLVSIDNAAVRLRILPLFTGKVALSVKVNIGAGKGSGNIYVYPKQAGSFQITDLELAAIPVLANAIEGDIKGTVKVDAQFKDNSGEAKLRINSLGLSKAKFAAMPLPDLTVPETRGLLRFNNNKVNITNMAMQGEGIYLRLNGSLSLNPDAPLNLKLELLPSAELLEKQKSVFLIMLPYTVAPGRYTLPIGGTLSAPQLISR